MDEPEDTRLVMPKLPQKVVYVRMTHEEHEAIKKCAKQEGYSSLNQWAIEALWERVLRADSKNPVC